MITGQDGPRVQMLSQNSEPKVANRLRDDRHSYGWVSILLHWLTAALVIALWLLGKSIASQPPDGIDLRRALHVSIAASAWLLILIRIGWRLASAQPRVRGQSRGIHRIAKGTHYLMLCVLLIMLLSGPVLVWARGESVRLFGALAIAGPVGTSESTAALAHLVHANAAMLLFWLVLLHVAGALKQLMFHSDETFARMLWPGRRGLPETGQ